MFLEKLYAVINSGFCFSSYPLLVIPLPISFNQSEGFEMKHFSTTDLFIEKCQMIENCSIYVQQDSLATKQHILVKSMLKIILHK